jgi:predicted nucleic acid-binding protein
MILCDTNIFFELFRGNEKVSEELIHIGFGNVGLSDLSVGEIYFGMRKGEERKTRELINQFHRFPITKESSKQFIEIMADKSRKKITIPDALIAAVAKVNGLKLFTLNEKDFKHIGGLELYKPKSKLK